MSAILDLANSRMHDGRFGRHGCRGGCGDRGRRGGVAAMAAVAAVAAVATVVAVAAVAAKAAVASMAADIQSRFSDIPLHPNVDYRSLISNWTHFQLDIQLEMRWGQL